MSIKMKTPPEEFMNLERGEYPLLLDIKMLLLYIFIYIYIKIYILIYVYIPLTSHPYLKHYKSGVVTSKSKF